MDGYKGAAVILLIVLAAADAAAWFKVVRGAPPAQAAISFLDVGQGDGILLALPGGVSILTDAGPDARVLRALEKALPDGARSIDLAIVTHPELDHFNGFNHLLAAGYRFGAFVVSGRTRDDSDQWKALLAKIAAARIPLIAVGEGDRIRHAAGGIAILAPGPAFAASGELNDTGIVQKIFTQDFTALLTADVGVNAEEYLRARYDLATDILKLGHHGSKYSSGALFLAAARPAVAAVSVATRNTYGHPAKETLGRVEAAGIPLLRTDEHGTVTVRKGNGALVAETER